MKQIQIIILDTDNVTSTLLRSMLSELSSNTTIAYTVHEAAVLSSDRPSVIIMRNSFKKHGSILQTMRELSIKSPESEFILVTADPDADVEASALENGFADVLLMPFSKKLVCARVSRVMRNIKNIKELTEQASEDTLTGLLNRREFDRILPDEIRKSIRNETPLSFLMLDVDHFKLFNDTYGHMFGDRILTMVGQVLSDALRRPGDCAFRYGGEEFSIILPNTDHEGANRIAKSIVDAVRKLSIPHQKSLTSDIVTISVGVSTTMYDTDNAYNSNMVAEIIESADQMLYKAKRKGRNCVISCEKNYIQNTAKGNS